ncbi:hypothetical protein, partial [Piscinibacter sp.]|uniref:hypothetical protein n=1 Tax=Piscinibacter sp. TaxID=1903157 RepID=UPI0035B21C56
MQAEGRRHRTACRAALRGGAEREHGGDEIGQQRGAAPLGEAAHHGLAHHRALAGDGRLAAQAQRQVAGEQIGLGAHRPASAPPLLPRVPRASSQARRAGMGSAAGAAVGASGARRSCRSTSSAVASA